jgi:hypothetical protein
LANPVSFSIPHKLGRETAKERIGAGVFKLADVVPGAKLKDHDWQGDRLNFTLTAMGQKISCRLDVREEDVGASFVLPPMLQIFSDSIKEKIQKEAPKLLG